MSPQFGIRRSLILAIGTALLGAACSSAAPATPTKPAAPAATAAPAGSPAAANPAASPAASPVASPAAGQAAPAASSQSTARLDPSLASAWQGKTVTFVVAENPGGGYDTWARLTGRHLNRFIPGQPNLIVENMPGGSHRIGMNHIYASKPDGLTLGMVERHPCLKRA